MHMYLSRLSVSKAVTQCLIPMCFSFLAATASAAGMKPDTTIVFVDVADKEGTINVTNTDNGPLLLLTSLSSIPEDKESLLVVDPPISRLEAGQKQLVRFIVQAKQPITTQRLKRVTFEGIPQEKPGTSSTVSVNVRQNIPVIIHPAGLAQKSDPWVLLKWSLKGNVLNVTNDSPYVVRMSKSLKLIPHNALAELPHNYVLPGQSLNVQLPANSARVTSVEFTPASLYGFAVDPFIAPLN